MKIKRIVAIATAVIVLAGAALTPVEVDAATKYVKIKRTTYNTMKSTISSQKKTISSQKKTITSQKSTIASYKTKVSDRDATIKEKNSTIQWLYRNMEAQNMHYSNQNHAWVPNDGNHDTCTPKDCPFWYGSMDGHTYHMSPDQIIVFEHQEAREWLED